MKYTTKIISQENRFKGLLYKGDMLVYETDLKIDVASVSHELTNFIKNDQPAPLLNNRNNLQNNLVKPIYNASTVPVMRKKGCCGN